MDYYYFGKLCDMEYEKNILYIDVEKLEHRLILSTNHQKRIRLYLGETYTSDFNRTINSIVDLPIEKDVQIRSYIKSIFKN